MAERFLYSECQLCHKRFKRPHIRVLSCSCSLIFCQDCLKSEQAKDNDPTRPEHIFDCPFCKTRNTYEGAVQLPNAIFSNEDTPQHSKLNAVKCAKHHKEYLSFYCRDCNIFICKLCKVQYHVRHAAHKIETVAAEKRQELTDALNDTELNIKHRTLDTQTAKVAITDTMRNISRELVSMYTLLTESLYLKNKPEFAKMKNELMTYANLLEQSDNSNEIDQIFFLHKTLILEGKLKIMKEQYSSQLELNVNNVLSDFISLGNSLLSNLRKFKHNLSEQHELDQYLTDVGRSGGTDRMPHQEEVAAQGNHLFVEREKLLESFGEHLEPRKPPKRKEKSEPAKPLWRSFGSGIGNYPYRRSFTEEDVLLETFGDPITKLKLEEMHRLSASDRYDFRRFSTMHPISTLEKQEMHRLVVSDPIDLRRFSTITPV